MYQKRGTFRPRRRSKPRTARHIIKVRSYAYHFSSGKLAYNSKVGMRNHWRWLADRRGRLRRHFARKRSIDEEGDGLVCVGPRAGGSRSGGCKSALMVLSRLAEGSSWAGGPAVRNDGVTTAPNFYRQTDSFERHFRWTRQGSQDSLQCRNGVGSAPK